MKMKTIATYDQARAAIAKLPRERIDALVLDVIEALYGEVPHDFEDGDSETAMWLNADHEWDTDELKTVASILHRNHLNPLQIRTR